MGMKLTRKFYRFERQKLGIVVLAGLFLASVTFVALPKPSAIPSPTPLSVPLSSRATSTSLVSEDDLNSQISDGRLENATTEIKDAESMNTNPSTTSSSFYIEVATTSPQFGNKIEAQKNAVTCDDPKSSHCEKVISIDDSVQNRKVTVSNHSDEQEMDEDSPSSTNSLSMKKKNANNLEHDFSTQKEDLNNSDKLGWKMSMEREPLCNTSDPRSDICEMHGDVRIHGNSSSITSVESNPDVTNSWKIRPYARKGDDNAFGKVREVLVRSSKEGPSCTHYHDVPAIIFSSGGYSGNLFHDFTDVMVPLFLTTHQFNGKIQFLISDMNIWWVQKYQLVLQSLSIYPIIDFDKEHNVHCFPHVIVGVRCHKEFSIDPSRAPNGYSMVNFTKFMRSSLSLEREAPIRISEETTKKPRLLIISRNRTRAFLNVDEIVQMAEELGYEAVVAEPRISSDVAQFARIVNSCDVMMGVHGAGLTNLVYLPTNATVIQIVPWGGLEWISMLDFGDPAKDMKLKYLQYSISAEESSLIEKYPRDHEMFKNPYSYHQKGWDLLRDTFMNTQNVRLDVKRFRAVLLKALEYLQ